MKEFIAGLIFYFKVALF